MIGVDRFTAQTGSKHEQLRTEYDLQSALESQAKAAGAERHTQAAMHVDASASFDPASLPSREAWLPHPRTSALSRVGTATISTAMIEEYCTLLRPRRESLRGAETSEDLAHCNGASRTTPGVSAWPTH